MQGALTAARIAWSAVFLPGANDQGVEFIIQRRVGGEAALKQFVDFFIRLRGSGHTMSLQYAPGIGVHHKHGVFPGIE
jgi:hypothetical protein